MRKRVGERLSFMSEDNIMAKTNVKSKFDVTYAKNVDQSLPGVVVVYTKTYETGGKYEASKRKAQRESALKKILKVDEKLGIKLADASDADIQSALQEMYHDGRLKMPKPRAPQNYAVSKFCRRTFASGKMTLSCVSCPRSTTRVIGHAKIAEDGSYRWLHESTYKSLIRNKTIEKSAHSSLKEFRSLSCDRILEIERTKR